MEPESIRTLSGSEPSDKATDSDPDTSSHSRVFFLFNTFFTQLRLFVRSTEN